MLDKSALYIAATHGVIRLERKYLEMRAGNADVLDKSALYIAATHGVIRLERKYISGWEDGRREIYDINESGENYTYSDNTSQFSTIAGNAT